MQADEFAQLAMHTDYRSLIGPRGKKPGRNRHQRQQITEQCVNVSQSNTKNEKLWVASNLWRANINKAAIRLPTERKWSSSQSNFIGFINSGSGVTKDQKSQLQYQQ